MSPLAAALWAETRKARRSIAPLATVAAISLLPLMGGLFMAILEDPERARHLVLLGDKARALMTAADWPAYLGLLSQATGVGGLVVFGFVATWVFGREHADGTITSLLALRAPRWATVSAKFLLVGAWSAGLAAIVLLLGLATGAVIGLPGWSAAAAWHGVGLLAATTALTVVLVSPIALAASAGRGYLPAAGFTALLLFLAQVLTTLGLGAYFPWSVPGLASGLAGPVDVPPGSYAAVVATGLAGVVATLAWWHRADQA